MKFSNYILLLILISTVPIKAQELIHTENNLGVSYTPINSAMIEERLNKAAKEFEKYAPVPRAAFYDICYAKDIPELKALGMNAVILITSISQNKNELPFNNVVVTSGDKIIPLEKIVESSSEVSVGENPVRKTFGSFRYDALYLLPMNYIKEGNKVYIDFSTNRKNFRLGVFDDYQPDYMTELQSNKEIKTELNINVLKAFLIREYPGLIIKENK